MTVQPSSGNRTVSSRIKAILAFVSLIVTNLLGNYAHNDNPLPIDGNTGQLNWVTLLVNLLTTAVGTGAVYQWPAYGYVPPAAPGKHAVSE